ncbi:MAG TPA: right-handed parallel beta-helix repeat-containing protein [Saprospiraceae bacterium]|nr:right-handed parallel beta-helix repeat-containing protein [Saprospiraceae bacterium]HMP25447.1 right-handed parallel beta-helix repeat-containing protein [Saprospiraceae bacterium]
MIYIIAGLAHGRKLILTIACLWVSCCGVLWAQSPVPLRAGMHIRQSTTIKPGVYPFASADLAQPVLIIEGDDIVVDFGGALLDGRKPGQQPDTFQGVGIVVRKGKNITIKNLRAKGFKVAILAENVDSLQITDSDFSYNYRMRLYSIRERENFQDWLSYHQNEQDEWLRYGAGIYLRDCRWALVRNVHISQNQNALLVVRCQDGLFYNNSFTHNSGLGIGLYRSGRNRIFHNELDFNVRGYSHGFYSRGQDSAGILVYEQSSDNVFAYNSARHCGDGFFLWAGQHTMDTGEGGCNNNLVYHNDFSYAPTNGIEVTFSSNTIIKNRLVGCHYGIWGGYSYKSWLSDNYIADNTCGIAIEQGQDNRIIGNYFQQNATGIQLWARANQPADWGYAQKRDVSSREYEIKNNSFVATKTPLNIAASAKIYINQDNSFRDFSSLLRTPQPNVELFFTQNDVYQDTGWQAAEAFRDNNRLFATAEYPWATFRRRSIQPAVAPPVPLPAPLPDAQLPIPTYRKPEGREHIRMNEWGPYNYAYPAIWLDSMGNNSYYFALTGPAGQWTLLRSEGFSEIASLPTGVHGQKQAGAERLLLEYAYTGPAFVNQWGDTIAAGTPYMVRFTRYEKTFDWQVQWHAYERSSDPLRRYQAFKNLRKQAPLHTAQTSELAYAWWGAPAEGVPADQFATFASTEFEIEKGLYRITLTSDDGLRLWLDGTLLIDRWELHEPTVDEIEIPLGGRHAIEIEHFDASGFANLDFRIAPIDN